MLVMSETRIQRILFNVWASFYFLCHDINLRLPYVILLQLRVGAGLVAVILTSPLTPFEIPIGVYRHSAYRAGVISEPHGHIGVLLASHHVEVIGGSGGWDVSHDSPPAGNLT